MRTGHCLFVAIIAAACSSAPASTPRISPTGLGYIAPVPARAVPDDGWVDPAPHRAFGVATAPGVKIHVLDFGGSGTPMIFLSGIGNNAHVWDDFARRFTKDHRVIAITRRGFGESSHPDSGYDQPTLARDIRTVMDSMNIRRAVLVGHSIGGYELTHFGAMYPDRVVGLIYLDAGSDRVAEDSIRKALGVVAAQPASPSPQRIMPTDQDSASPKAAWAYRQRVGLTDNTEQAVRASYFYEGFNPYLGNYNPVPGKMQAEIAAGERTPFAKVNAPAIFIFAGTNDPVAIAHRQFVTRELRGSETVSIPGARHLIFISHPDLVESYMKQFMSKHE
ncbi:MAG TPA: alpha/beta hydrolase [Gemmatimonadaceae bacterium]